VLVEGLAEAGLVCQEVSGLSMSGSRYWWKHEGEATGVL
jgi:hypothetical protein